MAAFVEGMTAATGAPATTPEGPGSPGPAVDRVDPFVLPSSTTSQFVLLVVLTLSSAAFTFDQIAGGPTRWEARYNACTDAADRTGLVRPAIDVTRGYIECFTTTNMQRGGVSLVAVLAVAVLLAVAVRIHPHVVVRRQGLFAWDPERFPNARPVIERCLAEANPPRHPRIRVEPFRAQLGGRAFGSRSRPQIRLSLALLRSGDDELLRAVLRHELAHVRNRDLTLTAVAVVVPYVFVVAIAAPLLLLALLQQGLGEAGSLGWRLAVLLAVLLVVRASIFRTREHHADVRASAGPGGFLTRAFPDAPGPAGGAWSRLVAPVHARLRAHPPAEDRAATVHGPEVLLRARFTDGLATGVTAAVAFCYLRNLLIGLLQGNPEYAALVAGVVVGLFVASVTGMSMWRSALVAAVTAGRVPDGVRPGLGLGAGLLAGQFLVPRPTSAWPAFFLAHPLTGSAAGVVLVLGAVVFLRWSASTATTWLAASRARTLAASARGGVVLGSLAFGSVFAIWFNAALGASVQRRGEAFWVSIAPASAFVLVPLVVAAAFPLLAAVRARGPLSPPRTVLLDAPAQRRLPVARTRPWLVLAPPLVLATALVTLDVTVFRGVLLPLLTTVPGIDPGAAGTDQAVALRQVLGLLAMFLGVEVATVAVVGALTGPRSVRTTFAHAFCAGTLTGGLLGLALLAFPFALACAGECRVITLMTGVGSLLKVTTLLALAAAAIVWAGGAVWAAIRWGRAMTVPRGEVARGPIRRALVGATAAAVALVLIGPIVFAEMSGAGLLPRDPVVVPRELLAAPSPTVAAPPVEVCRAYFEQGQAAATLLPGYGQTLRVARMGQISGSPALFAIGTATERAVLTGDVDTIALTARALYPICIRLVPQQ